MSSSGRRPIILGHVAQRTFLVIIAKATYIGESPSVRMK